MDLSKEKLLEIKKLYLNSNDKDRIRLVLVKIYNSEYFSNNRKFNTDDSYSSCEQTIYVKVVVFDKI